MSILSLPKQTLWFTDAKEEANAPWMAALRIVEEVIMGDAVACFVKHDKLKDSSPPFTNAQVRRHIIDNLPNIEWKHFPDNSYSKNEKNEPFTIFINERLFNGAKASKTTLQKRQYGFFIGKLLVLVLE